MEINKTNENQKLKLKSQYQPTDNPLDIKNNKNIITYEKKQKAQSQSREYKEIKKQKNNKHKQQEQVPKPSKLLTQIKHIFSKELPSLEKTQINKNTINNNANNNINTNSYTPQEEPHNKYMIKLSQIHNLLTTKHQETNKFIITPELLFHTIEVEKELKQLLWLFNNLVENKEVVVVVLCEVYRRVMSYIVEVVLKKKRNKDNIDENCLEKMKRCIRFLNEELFSSIEFLLEFQCDIEPFTEIKARKELEKKSNDLENVKEKKIIFKEIESLFSDTHKHFEWIKLNISPKLLLENEQKLSVLIKRQEENEQLMKLESNNNIKNLNNILQQEITNLSSLISLLHVIKEFSEMIIKYVEVINKLC